VEQHKWGTMLHLHNPRIIVDYNATQIYREFGLNKGFSQHESSLYQKWPMYIMSKYKNKLPKPIPRKGEPI
jgi:hypothetical protein